MLTPASLNQAIAAKLSNDKPDGGVFRHPCITIEEGEPQLGVMIHTSDGRTFVAPYVRFSAAIVDGVTIAASFGDFLVKVVRPQQPPDASGDESDKAGAVLLSSVIVAFQDQELRSLRADPAELEVTFELIEKDKKGGGGGKRGRRGGGEGE